MQPIRDAMPFAVAELIKAAPLSPGKADFAWRVAVGPAMQRNTAVRLESGVMVIEVASGQWADEVRRSSRVILARLQTLLGDGAVSRLEVRSR